jgi:ABC-2 type transport system ATP-binding protein
MRSETEDDVRFSGRMAVQPGCGCRPNERAGRWAVPGGRSTAPAEPAVQRIVQGFTRMVTLRGIRKSYGTLVAVDGLDLAVRRGEVFGLLGPNGAGKSTTVSLAVGLLAPDTGRVEIEGLGTPMDPKVRARIGVAPQALAIYDLLSGEENLRFFGSVYGLGGAALDRRVGECLAFVGLAERARDRASTYSGGMKRRLNLAAALVHDPDLLLLDEPTVGVDPQSRNQIFENITALNRAGKTIIYTTHYMEEAERLCDRIAVIDHGKLLALGTLRELLGEYGQAATLVVERSGTIERVQTTDPLAELNRRAADGPVGAFHVERATLEQVFLSLTGRSLRD